MTTVGVGGRQLDRSIAEALMPEIYAAIDLPYEALMLYGSQARGSADAGSDVDVLAVTLDRASSTTVGRVNISSYTPSQLRKMAKNSSLFVLHLLTEGITISDPNGILKGSLSGYKKSDDYSELLTELRTVAPALNVDRTTFNLHPQALPRLGIYILRTALYIEQNKHGGSTFDIDLIANGKPAAISTACALRRKDSFDYADLLTIASAIQALLQLEIPIPRANEEALQDLALQLSTSHPRSSRLIANVVFGTASVDYAGLADIPW
jgi:hypothetical protein